MKILFCDNGLQPFLNFRGCIAEHFFNSGHVVYLVVPQSTCTEEYLRKCPDYLKVIIVTMDNNGSNPISDLKYLSQLYSVFKSLQPDIVFTYTIKPNIYGSIVAHKLHIPVVAMVAGLGYAFSGATLKQRLGRCLYRYGLRKAVRVIVLNESNYRFLSKGFVSPNKLILFDSGEGVDLDKFPYHEDSYDSVRFLMVARVLYDKGYSEYVEAAKNIKKKYPNIEIALLGPLAEDSPMGVPESIVDKDHKEGTIRYLGVTDDVPSVVAQDSVVVVVVSSYHEGFNRSLMEACAMGRICIASNIPGCKEIVHNSYNGYLVEPKNPEELTNAMLRIIESTPEKRKKMAENSYNLARTRFDIKRVLTKYDNLLSQFFN